ncbi:PfkB family carbohydrate kinase [Microbacterium trichothecenolyticum]|uniref:Fructokinase n=1 Tax=Microbacterium trichothecenolyticum TaxID=69370 RepID=A0ABU0TY75_MICTR|nr:PfkB family carbohydrate kinase [Microbacterium trichothecenolyticum]MDQ1124593.1 fructokinase [Microbacterium trichothecenolyticum]
MTARVVVIGDALIDEIRDEAGTREFVGGAGLNVAVGLSRLGVPASLIAMVGDDEAGEQIRAFLTEHGVELLASPAEHGSSRAVSTRSPGGEPEYVFNDAAQNRRVRYGEAERAAIAAAPMVVVSCFPFDDAEQTRLLVDATASPSTPLAIDPNPRSGMLHDRAAFVRGFERAASGALLVKVGEDDAQLLYGGPLEDLRAKLTGLGVGAVLATYGAGGAAIDAAGTSVSRGISDLPGRIVDTMGGGDAVLATTVALVRDRLPVDAGEWDAVLARAMDVAAATCRHEGALLRTPEVV